MTLHVDPEEMTRLMVALETWQYLDKVPNAVLAELLFEHIVADLPVLTPQFALLSTIAERLREGPCTP